MYCNGEDDIALVYSNDPGDVSCIWMRNLLSNVCFDFFFLISPLKLSIVGLMSKWSWTLLFRLLTMFFQGVSKNLINRCLFFLRSIQCYLRWSSGYKVLSSYGHFDQGAWMFILVPWAIKIVVSNIEQQVFKLESRFVDPHHVSVDENFLQVMKL